jgi:hypothetical protein
MMSAANPHPGGGGLFEMTERINPHKSLRGSLAGLSKKAEVIRNSVVGKGITKGRVSKQVIVNETPRFA